MSNWVQVRYDTPTKYLRSFRYNLNQWAGWNYDGDRLNSGVNVNAHAMFTNNWGTGMGVNLNPQPFDDRAHARRARRVSATASAASGHYLESDERQPVSVGHLHRSSRRTAWARRFRDSARR